MGYEKAIAGIFVGAGALLLIWIKPEDITAAVALLGAMCGFFIGDANGKRTAAKDQGSGSP